MQFADPAWQPRQTLQQSNSASQEEALPPPQPVNAPLVGRAPPQSSFGAGAAPDAYASYNQGCRPQSPPQQSYAGPVPVGWQSARRKPRLWLILLLIGLGFILGWIVIEGNVVLADSLFFGECLTPLIIVGFLMAVLLITQRNLFSKRLIIPGGASHSETRTFSTGTHPTLFINNTAGTIRVQAGSEDTGVFITATRRGSWLNNAGPSPVAYDVGRDGNTIYARVSHGFRPPFSGLIVDFDITVPRDIHLLHLQANAGNISVQGVRGRVSLTTDAGSIQATQMTLSGNSEMKTNAGSITFAGAIDPGAHYEFESKAGSLAVTLPASSSFDLNARADVGSIQTDFPVALQHAMPGCKAFGSVGSTPRASLTLTTAVGSINLRRGV